MTKHDPDDLYDLDGLRISPEEQQIFARRAAPIAKAKKWKRQFVKVPWSWLDRLKDARRIATYRVAMILIYEFWRNGGRPVQLTNVTAAKDGVGRSCKRYALRELEQLHLIRVERQRRKSPTVVPLIDPRGK